MTGWEKSASVPLIGYQKIQPVVFANFFPSDQDEYIELSSTIAKIKINDNAFQYQKTKNDALGNGFRCGFLGFLHLEIIQARIEKEYNLSTIITTPTVKHQFVLQNNKQLVVDDLNKITDWGSVRKIFEPVCEVKILTPLTFLGKVMELIKIKRGSIFQEKIIEQNKLLILAEIPLAEIIVNFFEKLKSITNGYASFDYQIKKYQENDLVKLDILVNAKLIAAFSQIVHRSKTYEIGRFILEKLKNNIPRHNFQISLQAAINKKIIARENISALRKNVTAKCYGGDITRKRKLWDKQKKGKKRMKMFGKVNIPHETFLKVLKTKKN